MTGHILLRAFDNLRFLRGSFHGMIRNRGQQNLMSLTCCSGSRQYKRNQSSVGKVLSGVEILQLPSTCHFRPSRILCVTPDRS